MTPSTIPLSNSHLPSYPDLAGRVAIVTGGSRALGAATARLLARNGAKVAVNGRDRGAIDAVVDDIYAEGGTAIAAPADCTDEDALRAMHADVASELGPVDVLIAFAGGSGAPRPTEAVDGAEWRTVVDGNLTATFLTIRTVLPGMIENGHGAIVTMASSAGRLPGLAAAAYAASKAGIVMLTKHLANEMAHHGVRFNCIAPSSVMNERMEAHTTEEQRREIGALFPLGRIGQPIDVGLATLFLASDASSWITGVTLDVAGGRIIV